MTKLNDQGIGDTIVADKHTFVPTKDGVAITVKTPYENVVLNLTNAELMQMQSKHLKLERELGKEPRWYGHSL